MQQNYPGTMFQEEPWQWSAPLDHIAAAETQEERRGIGENQESETAVSAPLAEGQQEGKAAKVARLAELEREQARVQERLERMKNLHQMEVEQARIQEEIEALKNTM
jgi:hypothetical protein